MSASRWGKTTRTFSSSAATSAVSVTIARSAKSRLLGARWPATYPPRLQRLPSMKPGEFLTTTNEI